ncbi:uncharacterized protein LOC112566332 [Pomacea canaliculata]|uniref:uncharacterized protein LOC112566332 n=1 Tax=Pomacea canaliculata TaxID=400727 RepID=UPI000D73B7FE|nr:uncharacterized protein LOC112566332 [Pomacea canaliculata]XP_025098238.1 uncharacterized protein LOC112566332 [Pomacea canaliculata]
MEDARRRAADEKVLRIDHSDVYLENDRLSEELGKSLDTIFRAKHRTVINHVYEMRQLRRSLNAAASRNPRTISSVTALRPHTSPMYIRTRAPRVVKLDVHVPSAHAHADSVVGGGSHPHSRPNTHERAGVATTSATTTTTTTTRMRMKKAKTTVMMSQTKRLRDECREVSCLVMRQEEVDCQRKTRLLKHPYPRKSASEELTSCPPSSCYRCIFLLL